ncbi:hypothetical protein [Gordonia sp. ABSL49_1]|uniref:hypothetical protein n=1 Tax=Gordonia sp. ABSL49_1 TaxID=2920941 RepID=UPI001F105B0A|nr:hypothetical protein [Gordonia sp. ABSL49_1]MCH5643590.1 hypothetical protein [Gordonia sp. ABSL49_1]
MGDNYTSNDDMGLQLPGYEASDIDSVRRGPNGPGGVVRFSTEDWEGRARTAEAAADTLQQAIMNLNRAVPANYFGDCIEGQKMYERVRTAIDSWQAELSDQRTQMKQLAIDCRHAGARLDGCDISASASIQT